MIHLLRSSFCRGLMVGTYLMLLSVEIGKRFFPDNQIRAIEAARAGFPWWALTIPACMFTVALLWRNQRRLEAAVRE